MGAQRSGGPPTPYGGVGTGNRKMPTGRAGAKQQASAMGNALRQMGGIGAAQPPRPPQVMGQFRPPTAQADLRQAPPRASKRPQVGAPAPYRGIGSSFMGARR